MGEKQSKYALAPHDAAVCAALDVFVSFIIYGWMMAVVPLLNNLLIGNLD